MTTEDIKTTTLLDLSKTIAKPLLERTQYPWEVLPKIKEFILFIGETLSEEEYNKIGDKIWIHKSVVIPPTVCLGGPMIICEGAQIRHCAFFRGSVIIGAGAVAGNSCEFKNSVLFDGAQTPHYNYIGDSVIGHKSHMGAGALTSNLKSDKSLVEVHLQDKNIKTGLKKFGAILGDYVEVGCGSVLNPGSVIGRHTTVYPLSAIRGCVPAGSIYKRRGEIAEKYEE